MCTICGFKNFYHSFFVISGNLSQTEDTTLGFLRLRIRKLWNVHNFQNS